MDIVPATQLASFDVASLPDVDVDVIHVLPGPGTPSHLQLVMSGPKKENFPSPTCEKPCFLCDTASPDNLVDQQVLVQHKQRQHGDVCPRPDRYQPTSLQGTSTHKLAVATNLPITIICGVKTAKSNTRQRPPPRPKLPGHHYIDENKLSGVFSSFEDGFRAVKALATCLRWVYAARDQQLPSLYDRTRQVMMQVLRQELPSALRCRERYARGAQSDLVFEIQGKILFARGRQENFPINLTSDTKELLHLHPQAVHSLCYAVPFLCGSSPVARSLARHFHKKACGSSPAYIKALLDRQFLICHILPYLQQLRKNCSECRLLRPAPISTEMAPLPFDYSKMEKGQFFQVDVAGPWSIQQTRPRLSDRSSPVSTRKTVIGRIKVWLLLAVDSYDRRLHCVPLTDMSLPTFMAAYRALTARAGGPTRSVQVDAAPNLIHMKRLMLAEDGHQQLLPEENTEDFVTRPQLEQALAHLQQNGVKVTFTQPCPHRPWAQGRIERAIQTFKASLYRAFHHKPKMTLVTLMYAIEMVLAECNSRPLCYVPGIPQPVLTPNRLSGTHGGLPVSPPIQPASEVCAALRVFEDNFRHNFLLFVLPQYKKLFGRVGKQEVAKEGDVVLILDRITDQGVPQLGKVVQVDQNARKCSVQYMRGGQKAIIERPFQGLSLVAQAADNRVVHMDPWAPFGSTEGLDPLHHHVALAQDEGNRKATNANTKEKLDGNAAEKVPNLPPPESSLTPQAHPVPQASPSSHQPPPDPQAPPSCAQTPNVNTPRPRKPIKEKWILKGNK